MKRLETLLLKEQKKLRMKPKQYELCEHHNANDVVCNDKNNYTFFRENLKCYAVSKTLKARSTLMYPISEVPPLAIALGSITLGATGQFLFRLGMLSYGKVTVTGIWGQLGAILFTPAIFLGFLCFGLSSFLWLVVISHWELSYAYPLVALGYVLVILYGTFLLHEHLTFPKILGSILILAGISVFGLWSA
jgi:multidrug transporter EmrE-like cation transporter